MFLRFIFIKFVWMMKNRSLKYVYFSILAKGIKFIVNWLVNPRFGEDFFCANFSESTKLNKNI